jgi:hypothetical protein
MQAGRWEEEEEEEEEEGRTSDSEQIINFILFGDISKIKMQNMKIKEQEINFFN